MPNEIKKTGDRKNATNAESKKPPVEKTPAEKGFLKPLFEKLTQAKTAAPTEKPATPVLKSNPGVQKFRGIPPPKETTLKNSPPPGEARVKTGIEGLDLMLKGGFLKGRNILLSGPSGSGKSTLALQFVYEGSFNGEKTLYVTLEENKEKLTEDMKKLGFDLESLRDNENLVLLGGPIAKLTTTMKKVDADIYNIIGEIEEIVKEKNITRVVIDSINLLTMLVDEESERRKSLAALSNTLSSLGCTSILISETEEGTMKLSRYGIEEFIVDGVVVLYLVRQGSRFVPGIVIRKMRGSDHDKEIRVFKITNKGIIVYPQETMFGNL